MRRQQATRDRARLVTAPAAGSADAAPRWIGLDALRGLAIAAMILVNNPGSWGSVYAPLRHAAWHGCTPTDLVFPTFLFCAGVAIVPALGGALRKGRRPGELVPRIVRRMVALILLGLLLSAFPLVTFAAGKELFAPLLGVRFPGVLQRIGVCYAIAALLFLFTSARTQRWTLVGCLLLYWPLLALTPTPDGGAPDLATTGDHLAGYLDRVVFGAHKWKPDYDPEGLLSTIPAVATTLLGVAAGRVLTGPGDKAAQALLLFARGALLAIGGYVWGWFFPINKPLWTSSYALFTGGLATMALALGVWAFELRPWQRWSVPLQIYGRNALLVFVGSGLLGRVVGRLWRVETDTGPVALQTWVFRDLLTPWADPYLASLLWAVGWVTGWFVVLWLLWRRNWIWRV